MKALVYNLNPLGWAACKLLRPLWPGCITSGLGGLRYGEVSPPPLPGPEWVLCRTILGGICGTDAAILQQRQRPDSFLQGFTTLPAVLGHENVAVVDHTGPAVDASWRGRRVCVEPTLCCRVRGISPPCKPCQAGHLGACENFSASGLGDSHLPPGTSIGYCGAVGGSWGQYFAAHISQLVPLGDGLPDELAILTDPLACGLHAALRPTLGPSQRILVYGGGILGLAVTWALRATGFGGRVEVIARHEHQAKLARQLGADDVLRLPRAKIEQYEYIAARTGARVVRARLGGVMLSGGYEVVFDCVGSPESVQDSLRWAAGRGQVVLVGTGDGRGADLTAAWFSELKILGAYGRSLESFAGRSIGSYQLTHELMAASAGALRPLLTHVVPLEDYRHALTLAMDKAGSGSVKVAFRHEP